MTGNRTSLTTDRPALFAPRSVALIRGTVLRIALGALIFSCTASAIAGDQQARTNTDSSNLSAGAKLRHWFQTGQASWYGMKFQGHKTATGEAFNMNAFTCAHRNLPLGSWLRVTNLRNRKSVIVRVNDRGPMIESRIVDLSYAAANAVGLHGTGKVGLEVVPPTDPQLVKDLLAQLSPAEIPQLIPHR